MVIFTFIATIAEVVAMFYVFFGNKEDN